MILFLHNRYRTTGGEERAVEDLLWLVREHLGEDAELLERDSAGIGRRGAAAALLRGGGAPEEVARAVRRTGARIVHVHNLHPSLGWRALAAARRAGARVVLHLHQYRLVCAVGVCYTRGADCTRCHGRNTLPGALLNCRGSRAEALAYAASLSAWQRRLVAHVDAFVVPSEFAAARLKALGAPVQDPQVLPPVVREFGAERTPPDAGRYALVAARLAPEKGIDVAVAACRVAGIPLLVAGDGPERGRFADAGPAVRFVGQVGREELAGLRRAAALALVPSRCAETFGLAAAEAMAAGLPVLASRIGALPELVPDEWLVPPGDPPALAAAITRVLDDATAGARALSRIRAIASPDLVAARLAEIYQRVDDASSRARPRSNG
jgi:glycosyltransferase involved in cell wall biosynthesis